MDEALNKVTAAYVVRVGNNRETKDQNATIGGAPLLGTFFSQWWPGVARARVTPPPPAVPPRPFFFARVSFYKVSPWDVRYFKIAT